VEQQDVRNEIRALEKLCRADQENSLILVFNHCQGSTGLFPDDLYQIDMELCTKSLRDEIKSQTVSLRDAVERNYSWTDIRCKCRDIVTILAEIAQGLDFIHSQKEVHRDLKPENGNYHSPSERSNYH